ncbi:SseB family protein [Inconstantimicrobium porci]|uniref:SseB family protein n=1 Tax=Inconstantimicrobium porci TaxID=2652291 RepID=A0A7X2MXN8_9CLOT|nr:SseB family protein [Inconstantimicrobium porci]
MNFALITNSQEKAFVPLFTDWLEFEKSYSKDEWNGMIININDALSKAKNNEGMVINPFGENLIISNVLASEIFKDLFRNNII